jgi:hypothetical protein
MKEYIEKQAALDCFHDWVDRHGNIHTADEVPEYRAIEALPAANVQENNDGYWIYHNVISIAGWEKPKYECSACGKRMLSMSNFCPHCGSHNPLKKEYQE